MNKKRAWVNRQMGETKEEKPKQSQDLKNVDVENIKIGRGGGLKNMSGDATSGKSKKKRKFLKADRTVPKIQFEWYLRKE